MITLNKPSRPLDGTTGGSISANPEYYYTQAAISGRATGVINVKGMSYGSDVFEEFSTAINIDLADDKRTVIIKNASVVALQFTPAGAGDDFVVTLAQWKPTN